MITREVHGGAPPAHDRRVPFADDHAFDEQLPKDLRWKAGTHFTPIEVARHAARLLAPEPGTSVLDVGSGAGKFCIAAAGAAPAARFTGVEWRAHLVDLATHLAARARIANVRFVFGDALDLDWSAFDAFYFFNPFAEQLLERPFVLDHTIAFDPVNFDLYTAAIAQRLAARPAGTRVVTFHGFGAPLPASYELARTDRIASDQLDLWIQRG
jgi:SAM-dependent methyltransferase